MKRTSTCLLLKHDGHSSLICTHNIKNMSSQVHNNSNNNNNQNEKSILVEAVQRQQRDTRRSGRQTLASLTEGQDQNAAWVSLFFFFIPFPSSFVRRATPATSQQLKFSRKNTQKKRSCKLPRSGYSLSLFYTHTHISVRVESPTHLSLFPSNHTYTTTLKNVWHRKEKKKPTDFCCFVCVLWALREG